MNGILTHPALAFKARFRLGDMIAALTLLHLIESQRTQSARWYAADGDAMTTLKNLIAPTLPDIGNLQDLVTECGGEREGEHFWPVVDGNLWQWNNYFFRTNFHLPERTYTDAESPAPASNSILFAPLMECGYATERVFHPAFVEDVIALLSSNSANDYGGPCQVIMPKGASPNTRDVILEACQKHAVSVVDESLERLIPRIATAGTFIGGDTGLSHVAGVFPAVRQMAIHDRGNTQRHGSITYDHQQYTRMVVIELAEALELDPPNGSTWNDLTYRSFPNKWFLRECLMDSGGTLDTLISVQRTLRDNARSRVSRSPQ